MTDHCRTRIHHLFYTSNINIFSFCKTQISASSSNIMYLIITKGRKHFYTRTSATLQFALLKNHTMTSATTVATPTLDCISVCLNPQILHRAPVLFRISSSMGDMRCVFIHHNLRIQSSISRFLDVLFNLFHRY
ncbi:hypothetical protein HHX47_DHR7000766 [Lentinula edodes]|nr:hypothetical protein HHX47_DHR7000766 [Lentinula edodes]